jgi:hypothetical protein
MTVTTPAPTPPVHPHPSSLCPSDIVTLSHGHRLDGLAATRGRG